MTREKRAFTRITLDIPASLSLYQLETCLSGAITNISLSGCYFPFSGDLPLGEQCLVTITVGAGLESEEVTISGTIVRSDEKGVGIKFNDDSPESRLQLEKIIAHETKSQFIRESTLYTDFNNSLH